MRIYIMESHDRWALLTFSEKDWPSRGRRICYSKLKEAIQDVDNDLPWQLQEMEELGFIVRRAFVMSNCFYKHPPRERA